MGDFGETINTTTIADETDVLIVGAGPSGTSLGSFLGLQGIEGLIISEKPCPPSHPRANYLHMAGLECLREIGLEEKARAISYPVPEYSTWTRLVETMTGEEVYRAHVFGNSPHRKGEYYDASPSEALCLCQTDLEPLLIEYAESHGFKIRWNTRLVSFEQDLEKNIVISTLENTATGETYKVQSKQLAGADGADSTVVKQLDLPLVRGPGNGFVTSVWLDADLTHLTDHNRALLNYLQRPDKPQPEYGMMGIAHFIRPWKDWDISLFPHPTYKKLTATNEQVIERVKELVNDDTVEYKIKDVSVWNFEEVHAEHYSVGNVHGVGTAVHRHPPFGGLGISTCLEDSYNLAWKMAAVLKGKASKSLLDTYNAERQPAGEFVVKRTNENGRLNFRLYGMLGYFGPLGTDIRAEKRALLREDSEAGEAFRQQFRNAIRDLADEHHGLGAMMNQWYKSTAVYTADETEAPYWPEDFTDRSVKLYTSTYPGWRVPHAWLTPRQETPGPRLPLVSTRDVCGKGRFTLLTGIGGKALWAGAAEHVSKTTGIEIHVASIGFGQDYGDTEHRWFKVREVGEKGAVLVRPDRTVAWRAMKPMGDEAFTTAKLQLVMNSILGLEKKMAIRE
ncbi:UbiH 2-polyprenyl-6-methoxyphenol hydroxylase [Pyrenophora tritici-repentis]|uniref:FAD binding domain containing protein n=1 Tax=Pyrenophora tritici-repentis TaxID=45151 RepID=A0A2W1GBT5_9PLEO|nr:UbiH 2-polyprenyl-6-methoxyphenol hydroxylase and related FAD-dependent oxidoreductase [Pyrenophora tritici-repentis]KAF7452201.1 UbiH 2-polyprenyl-6-methoxyphenol hydroxylase [Pyrenophora tritici-repentis]KAF7574681.1 UbiH, 2-polyprenyl-6-methoxyphenol hydroxylase and related FAD-dependent oxidoreductase [Pyrenophora tritici-repentis]KAI0577781.1 UbiH 2-polyprenyl-6-methoxyphenol hydroxylase and related FAD-dependent oxidoreductase [Pyrenophora tritici-repentis]KAI0577850.1 UbiH 2-polypreny